MYKILLTSASFKETPGKHHELLKNTGFEIDVLLGPLKEGVLKPIIAKYDGVICGDDEYTSKVIEEGSKGKLKVLSKYGIGLDKINLDTAKQFNVKVTNCPGVNHTTVAEHVFALLLSYCKNIPQEINYTRSGQWKRITGTEIYGKSLGIFGLGKIGKEVAKRANAFGLTVMAYDKYWDTEFANTNAVTQIHTPEELCSKADIICLNMDLNAESKGIISEKIIKENLKQNCIIINTARGELISLKGLLYGLENKIIKAYLTDVLEEEPMPINHPLKLLENVFITPHVGSRTFESVERQGSMAVENLINALK
ncbi:MAG: phosphoglycerate dehydrogenase [Bacteroidia bacterium]|nr:phosphoglycerate dehydrogenase [Bacteroidia bacterium]